MSHFSVLVFTDEKPTEDVLVKTLLPWHEYECTGIEEYVEFVEAEESRDELEKEFQEYKEKYNYETFENFLSDYHGYKIIDGKIGRHTNPNAQWDWWEVGGRFRNKLVTKDGTVCDSCKYGDLDFDAMIERLRTQHATWWAEAMEKPEEIRYFAYGINPTTTREEYVEDVKSLDCFAFVIDGTWNEKGDMGWWGIVADEKDTEEWDAILDDVFSKVSNDKYITVVDCHI